MYERNKVGAIIQARMTSSRLPGKVLLPLAGKPVLQHIIERLRRSKYIDEVIVACTTNESDQPIVDLCKSLSCRYFRGSEDDVLTRVLDAAKYYSIDIIVEVTSDCPCVCPEHADLLIQLLVANKVDYCSNVLYRTYPRGLDMQVFWTLALERVNIEVDNPIDRQHVSSWMYLNPKSRYKLHNMHFEEDLSHIRITVDTEDDYKLLNYLFSLFPDNNFRDGDIIGLIKRCPDLFKVNEHVAQKSYYKELVEWYNQNTIPCTAP